MKQEIDNVDWSNFNGPTMYDAQVVSPALYSLMDLTDSNQAEEVGNKLIYALGNDHAGVYYPVVLKALDFLITIEKNTDSTACRTCALAVLNDLYYFEPDIEGYEGCTAEDLKKFVIEKLLPYSDEMNNE
ncbi:MAG: hypothetical protein PVJ68_19720 [Candidatus Thiodiazotropha sp.]